MASRTLSDDAYAELRRRILVLHIRPEERLKEEEWARNLKVGRLAVREALTRLHGEGLVSRGAKGGFFAAAMSPKDVSEIREVREIFETARREKSTHGGGRWRVSGSIARSRRISRAGQQS